MKRLAALGLTVGLGAAGYAYGNAFLGESENLEGCLVALEETRESYLLENCVHIVDIPEEILSDGEGIPVRLWLDSIDSLEDKIADYEDSTGHRARSLGLLCSIAGGVMLLTHNQENDPEIAES